MTKKKETKKKKPTNRRERFAAIPEDKPLTVKELNFCMEYIKTGNATRAAVNAGYAPKNATRQAFDLIHEKPNTRKFIEDKLAKLHERLDFEAYDLIKRAGQIALTNITEIMQLKDGRVQIADSDDWSEAAQALVASMEEKINERGDVSVKVNTKDSVAALSLLFKHHGLLENARMAPQRLHPEQVRALRAVRDGDKEPMEAALDLELCGVPIPRSLELMISRTPVEEGGDEGEMIIPTAQELEEKYQKRMAEIQEERDSFLPERQKEVRDMKAEMEAEGKQAFKQEPEEDHD